MTDQRQDSKTVRVDIESSVVTFGSGYDIGPKLRKSSNIVHNWIDVQGKARFPFSNPALPSTLFTVLNPAARNPNGTGGWFILPGQSKYFVGCDDSAAPHQRRIYDLETGLALINIGLVLGVGPVTSPWSFAFAGNLSEPTTFVTAGGSNAKKKIVLIGASLQLRDFTPAPFDPDNQPDFEAIPRVLYYHLNRIFLGYRSIVSRRSLVFFTDPFDPDTIRGTNFVDIPDLLNVIFRASASDVDIGVTPHLFFGCRGGIFVLDGDPTQGNASFRQIKKSFGIYSLHHVAEVSGGVCFMGTDGRVYFMPSGSVEPFPISDPIRNQFDLTNPKLFLGWRNPYLYVFDSTNAKTWIADLSGLPRSVYWSGPHLNNSNGNSVMGFVSDHPFVQGLTYVPLGTDNVEVGELFDHATAGAKSFQTGYFFEPNYDISLKRCIFRFKTKTTQQDFTLRCTNNLGLTDTRDFSIPAMAVPTEDTVEHALVVWDSDVVSFGRFFFLDLTGNSLENILDWQVEYWISARKN